MIFTVTGPGHEGEISVNAGTIDNIHELSAVWKPAKEEFCKARVQWHGEVKGAEAFSTTVWAGK